MSNYTPEEAYAIYKDVKARVSARWEKRGEFMIHVVIFAVALIAYAGVDTSSWEEGIVTLTNIFMVLWTAGFAGHAVDTIFHELRERAIDNEIDRLGLRQALYQQRMEKTKRENGNERLVRLGEDGELVDYDEDDYPQTQQNR